LADQHGLPVQATGVLLRARFSAGRDARRRGWRKPTRAATLNGPVQALPACLVVDPSGTAYRPGVF
jgi:hypothetical protein